MSSHRFFNKSTRSPGAGHGASSSGSCCEGMAHVRSLEKILLGRNNFIASDMDQTHPQPPSTTARKQKTCKWGKHIRNKPQPRPASRSNVPRTLDAWPRPQPLQTDLLAGSNVESLWQSSLGSSVCTVVDAMMQPREVWSKKDGHYLTAPCHETHNHLNSIWACSVSLAPKGTVSAKVWCVLTQWMWLPRACQERKQNSPETPRWVHGSIAETATKVQVT